MLPVGEHDPIYDDDNDLDDDEPTRRMTLKYISPVVGRVLGQQPVRRYDLATLRPFELMFVDNKDYEQSNETFKQLLNSVENQRNLPSASLNLIGPLVKLPA